MRKSKKKKSDRNKKKNRQYIFFLLSLCIIVLAGLLITYFFVLPGKTLFLSPLAKVQFTKSWELESLLQKSNILHESISVNGDNYAVYLKDNGVVFLSSKKEIRNQIASLQLILSRLTIEGKRFKSLDFRFNKPVILF